MSRFKYQIDINARPEAVWDIIADFGNVYRYSPGVKHSFSTSQMDRGKGATRHCDLIPFGSLEERILDWKEGEGYTLEIFEGKGAPPFSKAHATFRVGRNARTATVTVEVDYALRLGVLGHIMDVMMVGRFLRRGIRGLLAGIKHLAETGQTVESARGLEFAARPA